MTELFNHSDSKMSIVEVINRRLQVFFELFHHSGSKMNILEVFYRLLQGYSRTSKNLEEVSSKFPIHKAPQVLSHNLKNLEEVSSKFPIHKAPQVLSHNLKEMKEISRKLHPIKASEVFEISREVSEIFQEGFSQLRLDPEHSIIARQRCNLTPQQEISQDNPQPAPAKTVLKLRSKLDKRILLEVVDRVIRNDHQPIEPKYTEWLREGDTPLSESDRAARSRSVGRLVEKKMLEKHFDTNQKKAHNSGNTKYRISPTPDGYRLSQVLRYAGQK